MLVAEENGRRIEATEAKRGGSFSCPECKRPVTFKAGRIVVRHFAHKPPTDCSWAAGETRAHLEAKSHVGAVLRARGVRAEVEYYLPSLSGDRRADVLIWSPSDKQLAIELQHTPIGLDEIERRAFSYAEQGIAQLWVPFIKQETLDKAELRKDGSLFLDTYSARPFEKWVHGFHQADGMWMHCPSDKSFWKGRLASHELWVPETEWYDEYGQEQTTGGFYRYSRQHRELTLEGPYSFEALRIKVRSRKPSKLSHYNWPGGGIGVLVPPDPACQT